MATKKHTLNQKTWRKSALVIALAGVFVVGNYVSMASSVVRAEANCNTIAECKSIIEKNNNAVATLQSQATSYQDAIDRLNSQIYLLAHAIDANIAKQNQLRQQITQNKQKLANQKKTLGSDLKAIYVNGQMSTVEMLASSKSLSAYVDAETYRTAVQNKVQATLEKIKQLQAKLASQERSVTVLLAEQRTQQDQLANARQQQSEMLVYNQQQQDTYNAQTADNKKKLQELIIAQILANKAGKNGALIAGATSYPYANAGFSMSTAPGCVDNDGPDIWGYCTRQCVSYAAWAVAHSGRQAPMYYGNAKDWVWHALANDVPVYSFRNVNGYGNVHTGAPQPGDVAISTAGGWGHAMYIEAVSGTQIYVSQYNAGLDGQFSYQWRDASNYYFLRFP